MHCYRDTTKRKTAEEEGERWRDAAKHATGRNVGGAVVLFEVGEGCAEGFFGGSPARFAWRVSHCPRRLPWIRWTKRTEDAKCKLFGQLFVGTTSRCLCIICIASGDIAPVVHCLEHKRQRRVRGVFFRIQPMSEFAPCSRSSPTAYCSVRNADRANDVRCTENARFLYVNLAIR